jgi:hypothetical protein
MANTTWNPSDKSANITLSGTNNLVLTTTSNAQGNVRTVDRQLTGKLYWENTLTTITGQISAGIANQAVTLGSLSPQAPNTVVNAIVVTNSGTINLNGTTGASLGAFASGGVACFALDLVAQLFWIRNGAAGNWNGSATNNPATGVGGMSAPFIGGGIPAYALAAFTNGSTTSSITANFGDTVFTGAVPSGFTSGFPTGTPPLNTLTTQIAAEHWLTTNPPAQVTQVALEHWATVTGTGLQAIATQIALEHWATVASRSPGGPMITMIG